MSENHVDGGAALPLQRKLQELLRADHRSKLRDKLAIDRPIPVVDLPSKFSHTLGTI